MRSMDSKSETARSGGTGRSFLLLNDIPEMTQMQCGTCGGEMKYRDRVKRYVRTAYGERYVIFVPRYACRGCGAVRRVLPDTLLPYRHYEKGIIFGVVEGTITFYSEGFEDYPCEMTVKRWMDIYGRK